MGLLNKQNCVICGRFVMKNDLFESNDDNKFKDKPLYYCSRKDCKKFRTKYAHLYKSFKEYKEATK
jgi:hypothetical protein